MARPTVFGKLAQRLLHQLKLHGPIFDPDCVHCLGIWRHQWGVSLKDWASELERLT